MNKRSLGALQVALGAVCWSFAGVLGKWVSWNSLTQNGFRSLFGFIIFLILSRKTRVPLTKGNLLGAIGVAGTSILFMTANKFTSAANAIVLQYAMPIFVVLFFYLFRRQKPTRANLIAVACMLAGVMLCSWSGLSGGGSAIGNLCGILSALTFSLVFFCSKMEGANAIEYSLLGCALGIPFCISAFFDPEFTFTFNQMLAALALGACFSIGYFFVSLGMNNTDAITAAILANLEPVLNPVWVFLFLGENPGTLSILGAAIVLIAATIYSILGVKANGNA
ncbi:MAG: EamA family transporter [Clostridia bacterium]|nr:EamA family transporter [Clostridia bacterium]